MFLAISRSIVNAINLRISFCESLCKYLPRFFFSVQLLILGSIFELQVLSADLNFLDLHFHEMQVLVLQEIVYFGESSKKFADFLLFGLQDCHSFVLQRLIHCLPYLVIFCIFYDTQVFNTLKTAHQLFPNF